jgi:hypothetical protein
MKKLVVTSLLVMGVVALSGEQVRPNLGSSGSPSVAFTAPMRPVFKERSRERESLPPMASGTSRPGLRPSMTGLTSALAH